jgi:hypothetical protein
MFTERPRLPSGSPLIAMGLELKLPRPKGRLATEGVRIAV